MYSKLATTLIAAATVQYGIAVSVEAACADCDCNPSPPEDAFDWLEQNYYRKQRPETQILRNQYYDSLAEDVSRMLAFKMPDEMYRRLGFTDELDHDWRV